MIMRVLILFVILMLFGMTSCWSPAVAAHRDEPVPAAVEADRLRQTEPPAAAEVRDLRAEELAAAHASAQAAAAGDTAKAAYHQRLAEELAQMRAAAEQRERQQREQIAALAAEADRRAVAERDELDQRAAIAQRATDARQVEVRQQRDRRWAGWGLALAVAAGVGLRLAGFPSLLAAGVPATIGAACLTLAAWSSVPWLAQALGIALVGGIVVVLALVVHRLISEWMAYASQLSAVNSEAKIVADMSSRNRQGPVMRWIVSHLLDHQRNQPAAASV